MAVRSINKIVTGQSQTDGAGVKLLRVIGHKDVKNFDPFLMLDAFDSSDPDDYIKGFPWHPHRGIETVTYLIEGEIEHGDSLGNSGIIKSGECQWMTGGSGIVHQEMPQPSKRMFGVQLWINLPQENKMTNPEYRDITNQMIPTVQEDGSIIKIISGNYKNTKGAMSGDYVDAVFLDVSVNPNQEWAIDTNVDETVFAYIVEGKGSFDEEDQLIIEEKKAVLFNRDGDQLKIKTHKEGIRFLFFMGKPLNEPVAWGGPIVMNTMEELQQAFKEIQEGTFVKK
jgi:hypothetical protein